MKLRKILCGVTAAAITLGTLTAYAQPVEENDGTTVQTAAEADMTEAADDAEFTGEYTEDGITYRVLSDHVQVICPESKEITAVNIPAAIKGKPVTGIENNAFKDCMSLTEVTFAEGLTKIGVGAFENCTALKTVNFCEGLKEIGNAAFRGCESILALKLPKSTERIGKYAFYGCKGIYAQCSLNEGLEYIGDQAFAECNGLENVVIPYTVQNEPSNLFEGCDNLSSITVYQAPSDYSGDVVYETRDGVLYCKLKYDPGKYRMLAYPISSIKTTLNISHDVKYVDENNIRNAKWLTDIEVNSANPNFGDIDGVLVEKSENSEALSLCIYPPKKAAAEYTVPDSVSSIGRGAFSGTTELRKVTIPKTVFGVEYDAFNYNADQSSVTDITYEGTMEEWEFISTFYSHGSKGGDDDRPFEYGDIVVTCSNGTVDKNGMHPTDKDYERTTFFCASPVLRFYVRCDVEKGAFENEAYFSSSPLIENGLPVPGKYGVNFYDSEGSAVQPKGGFTVRISGSGQYVYSIDENGKYTEIKNVVHGENNYALEGDYVEFFTTQTGKFMVTDTKQTTEEPPVSSSSSSSSTPEEPPVSSSSSSSNTPEEPPVSSSSSSSSTPAEPPVSSSPTTSIEPEEPPVSSSSETPSEPEESTPDKATDKVTDKDTGITVEADKGTFEQETVLVVTPINTVITDGENAAAFDIKFLAGGIKVQPGKPVTVRIPVPASMTGKTIYVYHVDENGNYTDMNAKVENGMAVFTADHFSKYIITTLKHSSSGEVSKPETNGGNPSTGAAFAFLPVLLAAGAFTAAFTHKKK